MEKIPSSKLVLDKGYTLARTDKILDQVEERGRQDGIRLGREEERDRILRLIGMLLQQGRTGDIERVCADEQYCKDLLNQYGLQ